MITHRVQLGARPPPRLVDYAKAHLIAVPVAAVGALVARGAIRIGARAGTTWDLVREADELHLDAGDLAAAAPIEPQPIELVTHHADDDLLIVDKPAGMHVHPLGPYRTATLLNALLWLAGARPDQPWGRARPAAAHRLDRAASGLIAIARHAAAHDALRLQLAAGEVTRRYAALVHGEPRADAGTIDAPLDRDPARPFRRAVVAGGQPAVTHWRVVAHHGTYAELALELETGRTHQIRAHLAHLGHPILGDTLYAAAGDASAARIALHACELRVLQPRTRAEVVTRSPPAFAGLGSALGSASHD